MPYEPIKEGGWETARFCAWPQEVVIKLDYRAQLQHIMIMSKENREIPLCTFYVGDAAGNFVDCVFRKAGTGGSIDWLTAKQFELFGIGNYIKIVIPKPPQRDELNLNQQVGIGFLKIFGQPMQFFRGVVNNETPILKGQLNDELDRVLLEMGVPLSQPAVDWSFEDLEKVESIIYAPVDDDTRTTLKDIQKEWLKAHKTQDYEKMDQIGKDIKILLGVGNDILKLKRELQDCMARGLFEKAIDIRNQIQANESIRQNYDMVYETTRFEDMIEMGPPSEQFKNELLLIEMQEMKELEAKRKQDQIEF